MHSMTLNFIDALTQNSSVHSRWDIDQVFLGILGKNCIVVSFNIPYRRMIVFLEHSLTANILFIIDINSEQLYIVSIILLLNANLL